MPPEGAQAALVAFLHTFISDGFYYEGVRRGWAFDFTLLGNCWPTLIT